VLIACGNSICGNSAIAAVAPVIGADGGDVASSIAFTAILGVAAVLGLPLLMSPLGLTASQYGIFAGMTVYAVPQVLAATVPVAIVSVQIGTVVKLVRVMMLGPVVVALSLTANFWSRARGQTEGPAPTARARRLPAHRLAPWFIIGFLALAAARSLDLVPHVAATPILAIANLLTIVAMAALGLAVDLRELSRIGARVTLAVSGSLLVLGLISLALVRALALA
jgi:uncharacterized integral membrane protein (TIGR00698 family)